MPNPDEFMKVYDAHVDAIFRHCYFRVFDRERARDLVQETFLKTWATRHPEFISGSVAYFKKLKEILKPTSTTKRGEQVQRDTSSQVPKLGIKRFVQHERFRNFSLRSKKNGLRIETIKQKIGEKAGIFRLKTRKLWERFQIFLRPQTEKIRIPKKEKLSKKQALVLFREKVKQTRGKINKTTKSVMQAIKHFQTKIISAMFRPLHVLVRVHKMYLRACLQLRGVLRLENPSMSGRSKSISTVSQAKSRQETENPVSWFMFIFWLWLTKKTLKYERPQGVAFGTPVKIKRQSGKQKIKLTGTIFSYEQATRVIVT